MCRCMYKIIFYKINEQIYFIIFCRENSKFYGEVRLLNCAYTFHTTYQFCPANMYFHFKILFDQFNNFHVSLRYMRDFCTLKSNERKMSTPIKRSLCEQISRNLLR